MPHAEDEKQTGGGAHRSARGLDRHVANLHLTVGVWEAAKRAAAEAGISVTLEIETRLRAAYGLTRRTDESTPAPAAES